jgi:prepilin-type N-terminal cleavage/methylation domain-containing protein
MRSLATVRPPAPDAGFTLIETLVATALMLVVTGAMFSLVDPRTALAGALPEATDMQQRARVAADTLWRDLLAAGAGLDLGPDAGPLVSFLPPIVPRRMGLSGADASGVVRADAITLTWALGGAAQTTTSAAIAPALPALMVNTLPGCPVGDPLCGLAEGSDALVFDDHAHFDVFRIGRVQGGTAELRLHDPGASFAYPPGARVASVSTRTYYLDAANHQLRMNDGYLTDAPVVDNVVALAFSYFGDRNPPVAPKPAAGTANCLYDANGQFLGGMATLAPAGGSLAPLPLSMLNDGPWCGDRNNRFDADLLRVRRVRVTLRVQAGPDAFRATGPQFVVAGTSHRSDQALPDYVVTFDVTPRNMAGGAR